MDRNISEKHLLDAPQQERQQAIQFASSNPEDCQRVAAALAQCAGDPNESIAMGAAEALEQLGPPDPQQLDALVHLIQSAEEGEIVYWAITLIGRLGPSASCAAETLGSALENSPFLPVRERAAWAIARIGPAAHACESALRMAANEGPPRLSRLATQAIESIRGMAA